jgi:hypothetical protein
MSFDVPSAEGGQATFSAGYEAQLFILHGLEFIWELNPIGYAEITRKKASDWKQASKIRREKVQAKN